MDHVIPLTASFKRIFKRLMDYSDNANTKLDLLSFSCVMTPKMDA